MFFLYGRLVNEFSNKVFRTGKLGDQDSGWHGLGVFDKAVSSWFDNMSEEHGLTEDGKTVAPFSRLISQTETTQKSRKVPHRWFRQLPTTRRAWFLDSVPTDA